MYDSAINIISLLGLGSLIGILIKAYLDKRNSQFQLRMDFKFSRFKCIVILMYSALDFENSNKYLVEHGRQFSTLNDLLEELKLEKVNMILFASKKTVNLLDSFISDPTYFNLEKTVFSMKTDLWK